MPESDLRTALASVGRDPPRPGQAANQKLSQTTDLEEWLIVANPNHQWYYASEMQPREAWMFKIYDSRLDGTARRTPHWYVFVFLPIPRPAGFSTTGLLCRVFSLCALLVKTHRKLTGLVSFPPI